MNNSKLVNLDKFGYSAYFIDEYGNIYSSYERAQRYYKISNKLKSLKPIIDRQGRPVVALSKNGVSKRFKIARLVAFIFIGPPPFNNAKVCHNDGNQLNNHFSNLRYDTQANNMKDKKRHRKSNKLYGERSHTSKLTWNDVDAIRAKSKLGIETKYLALDYNVSWTSINSLLRNKTWKEENKNISENSFSYNHRYNHWREQVFIRDDYKCRLCKSNKDIQCHHLYSWDKFIDLRFNVDNGLSVCSSCHKKIKDYDCFKFYEENKLC